MSIVGAWGEGEGTDRLTQTTRRALLDCYLDTLKKTHLLMQLTDRESTAYASSRRPVGWRADCLGDMGGFSPTWSHMLDYYPENIISLGLQDAWRLAPVSLEVCWVMQHWKNKGWDVDYIIDQSLKWHISSFNAKSSPVPDEWWPQVNRWLKKMGYRFVLRKFTYPATVKPASALSFTSWWENKGVAPCYRHFPLALRLKSASRQATMRTDADITRWLPGDSLLDGEVRVPGDLPAGDYDLELAIMDEAMEKPVVKLAIAGITPDGWYPLGKIKVQ